MARGSQLSRQWQILKVLENFRFGISIDDLSTKVECSRRTIERDLSSLRDIGFPIQCETRDSSKKFWRLERHFLESDKFVVSPTEMVSMYLAKQSLVYLSGTCFGEGLDDLWTKIQALIPKKALNYFVTLDETIHVKSSSSKSNSPDIDKNLDVIRKAIDGHKILEIKYNPDDGEKGYPTEFHPYGLVIYDHAVYVIGHSVYADGLRTFKVQRLKKVALTKKTFKKPEEFSLERCVRGSFGIFYNEIKPITVRCEFSDWAARVIRERKWHSTQVIEKDSGNKLLASFPKDLESFGTRWAGMWLHICLRMVY